jgi:hypothetical protein
MHAVRLSLIPLSIAMACMVAACRSPEPPPPFYSPGQAATRTAVPLVRPFPLVPMSEPYVLEFDLLPPGRNSSSALTIALRANDAATGNARDITRMIRSSGLNATVILIPLDAQTPAPQLYTTDFDAVGPGSKPSVPVAADGRVRGVMIRDIDSIALDEAGLTEPGRDYRTLAFVWTRTPQPGRYRLELQLIDPAPELAALPVELLLAYLRQPK